MNFLILWNFLKFFLNFLNFSEFKFDLFDFYFCAGDVASSRSSDHAINHNRRSSRKAEGTWCNPIC